MNSPGPEKNIVEPACQGEVSRSYNWLDRRSFFKMVVDSLSRVSEVDEARRLSKCWIDLKARRQINSKK